MLVKFGKNPGTDVCPLLSSFLDCEMGSSEPQPPAGAMVTEWVTWKTTQNSDWNV